jgi:histone-lysine N-methyltransferase SETMAR
MYTDNIRRFKDAVRRKRLEKWRVKSWFLLYDNAPAHRTVFVKDFSAQNNVTTLHLPYSPDLVPTDFYLFPQLESALKRRRFCDSTDVTKNATKELKRLS